MNIEQWLGEENKIGIDIWRNKYCWNNESFDEWLDRVSGGDKELRQLIRDKKFLFGGRALSNRGTNKNSSMFNCYSRGFIEDDFDDIMQANTDIALTFKAQGGQGLSLSKLRPKGTLIQNVYKSDGIIPFMKLYNQTTETTQQGGCIYKDEKVLTPNGLRSIKDIQVGDKVWTKKGYIEVDYKFDKGLQDIYEVVTKKGYKIKTTINHKFSIDGFKTKELKDLSIGDKINIITGDKENCSSVNMVAYFAGLLFANGNVVSKMNGGSIAFNISEKPIAEKIINWFKDMNMNCYISEETDTYLRLYLTKEIIDFIVENDIVKQKTNCIKIPDWIMGGDYDTRISFLGGAIDSDGCVCRTLRYDTISEVYADDILILLNSIGYFPTKSKNSRTDRQDIYRISDSFRYDSCEIPSHKIRNKHWGKATNSRYKTPYTMDNCGFVPKNAKHLNKISYKDEIGLYTYLQAYEAVGGYIPMIYDEIVSITKLNTPEQVYDISLVEEHLFYCNGIYVSNSRKGALMISLDCKHKEVEDFITIKSNDTEIKKANLSLEVDNEFMQAVKDYYDNGKTTTLNIIREYSGQKVEYDIIPIKIFKLLCQISYDWADPAILYVDEFRNYNLMEFVGDYQIETSNPSLRKGTKILTSDGVYNIEDLENKEFLVPTLNKEYGLAKCFLSGKNKRLYKITLDDDSSYYCTKEHKWATLRNGTYIKTTTDDLNVGDYLPYTNVDKISNGTKGDYEDGLFFGFWYGDGSVTLRKDGRLQYGFTFGSEKIKEFLPFITNHMSKITNKIYTATKRNRGGLDWYETSSSDIKIRNYFKEFGIIDKSNLPSEILTNCSEAFRKGFIDGIISSDGHVDLNKKAERICLTSHSKEFAYEFSELLHWYGIKSKVLKSEKDINIGGTHSYKDYVIYEVRIPKYFSIRFRDKFKLTNSYKQHKIDKITNISKDNKFYNNNRIKSIKLTELYEDVWDISVYDDSHTFRLNTCITGNCGEQPMPKNFSCNLGSLNLYEYVENKFTKDAKIDYNSLSKDIYTSIKALDNLIDENKDFHAIKEQSKNSLNYRNVGLGVFGYANALMALCITYGSEQAKTITEELFKFMFRESVKASNRLAKEKGKFPKYNDKIWDSRIIKNSFTIDEINELKINGLRNCSLMSIAPTGSISTQMSRSGGCEPEFAIKYNRKTESLVKGEDKYYTIYCDTANNYFKLNPTEEKLPNYFVSSTDIAWKDRIDIQSLMQKYVDTAISSTVNLPKEVTIEDIEQLYLYAWEKKLKGITVYRVGCKREGILTTEKQSKLEAVEDKNIIGLKRKLITGCGSLHCTAFFNKQGKLMETYLSKGSEGGCNNFMIGLSRLISLSARANVDIKDIVDQLNSCGACPSYAVRRATKKDTSKGASCPIAIGKALLDMDKEMKIMIKNKSFDESFSNKEDKVDTDYPKCPTCNAKLYFEGGCNICKECGYSKCD